MPEWIPTCAVTKRYIWTAFDRDRQSCTSESDRGLSLTLARLAYTMCSVHRLLVHGRVEFIVVDCDDRSSARCTVGNTGGFLLTNDRIRTRQAEKVTRQQS
jgi:hypothetical protein